VSGRRDIAAELRDELLNGENFYSLKEAQVVIERWRKHYNAIRPHSALGYGAGARRTLGPRGGLPWPSASRFGPSARPRFSSLHSMRRQTAQAARRPRRLELNPLALVDKRTSLMERTTVYYDDSAIGPVKHPDFDLTE
jgi:hypothetical protein